MRSGYDLPTSIEINGAEYKIRTDYRAILDILIACADPELTPYEQQEVMFDILYIDGESIPLSDYREACEKAAEFIDCGSVEEKKKSPRLIDWEQDAGIIVPAVNKVAGKEIRALEYMHWWTFLSFFMEIGDGLFSQVLSIRQKKAKRKKLEKWEREFERENSSLVKLENKMSEEEKETIRNMEKWL